MTFISRVKQNKFLKSICSKDTVIMIPSELLIQSSVLFSEDRFIMSNLANPYGFSSDSFMFSNPANFPEFEDFPLLVEDMDVELPETDLSISLEDFEISEISTPPCSHSSIEAPLSLPTEDIVMDNNSLTLPHVIKAYEDSMDKGQRELAEVLKKCIGDKVSPVGGLVERVLYYLFKSLDKQATNIRQESMKNFHVAFKVLYQIFPYGKFAHSAANMAILEAMPKNTEVIHIVDFDMGEGIQWCSIIEEVKYQRREIRLTSIKWGEDKYCPPLWRFEDAKGWLLDHAQSCGIRLTVDNMSLDDLASEMIRKNKRGRTEWVVFNCMQRLPHMGRARSWEDTSKFLRVAKEALTNSKFKRRGIITFGDGDAWLKSHKPSSFGSFLDGHVQHYQALLESMEWTLPIRLGEARTALECIFVSPLVSSLEQNHELREMHGWDFGLGLGLEGRQVSEESLLHAKEMVKEGENLYGVSVEGENNNEMVLKWRGFPLVEVSSWRS